MYGTSEIRLVGVADATPVWSGWGAQLRGFLLWWWWVVIVVLQRPDFVDVAHCSHGVWHGHSWVWLVGENYCWSCQCVFVNGGRMVGSDCPVDLVADWALTSASSSES